MSERTSVNILDITQSSDATQEARAVQEHLLTGEVPLVHKLLNATNAVGVAKITQSNRDEAEANLRELITTERVSIQKLPRDFRERFQARIDKLEIAGIRVIGSTGKLNKSKMYSAWPKAELDIDGFKTSVRRIRGREERVKELQELPTLNRLFDRGPSVIARLKQSDTKPLTRNSS